MLNTGLKNFFKNLIYVFVPMGIIYLFLILFTFDFIFGFIDDLGVMLNDALKLVEQSVESSGAEIQDFIAYAEGQIDWNLGLSSIIKQIIDTNWIGNTLTGFFETLDISVAGFSDSINAIINTFIDSVKSRLVVGFVVFFIGVALANFLTGCLLRRKTARRTAKQFVVNWLLTPIFNALLGTALLLVATVIKEYTLLLIVAVVIVYVVMSLLFAWIIYRDNSLKIKEIVNFKNVALSIAVAVIILIINIVIFFLVAIFSKAIAILLLVPLLIYSIKIIDYNADSYTIATVKIKQINEVVNVEAQ